MATNLEQLTNEALALPTESRAFLAERLLESLDYEEDFPVSPAWIEEVVRRSRELDSAQIEGVPAAQVFEALRRDLGE